MKITTAVALRALLCAGVASFSWGASGALKAPIAKETDQQQQGESLVVNFDEFFQSPEVRSATQLQGEEAVVNALMGAIKSELERRPGNNTLYEAGKVPHGVSAVDVTSELKNKLYPGAIQGMAKAHSPAAATDGALLLRYGHLTSPNDGWLEWEVIPGKRTLITVYSCARGTKLKVKGATNVAQGEQRGSFFVSSAVLPSAKKKFSFFINPLNEADAGVPYLMVIDQGTGTHEGRIDAQLPDCSYPSALSQAELKRRFGALASLVGKTEILESTNIVVDYEWVRTGQTIRKTSRKSGKAKPDGWSPAEYFSFDERRQQLRKTIMYNGAADNWIAPPHSSPYGGQLVALRQDVADKRASSNDGGGFLGALQGAVAGVYGTAAGGGTGMESAIAGAVIGAVGGAAGADTGMVYNSMAQSTAEEKARQDDLRRRGEEAIAEGVRQGEALRAEREQRERELARQERERTAAASQRTQMADASQAQAQQQEVQRRQQAEADAAKAAEQRRADDARKAAEAKKLELAKAAEAKRKAAEEERNRPVTWREAVAVCEETGPKSWLCKGPRDSSGAYSSLQGNLNQVCPNGRSLGSQGKYQLYGCGYGINPEDNSPFYEGHHYDWIKALGLVQPPERRTYRCKLQFEYCRSQ